MTALEGIAGSWLKSTQPPESAPNTGNPQLAEGAGPAEASEKISARGSTAGAAEVATGRLIVGESVEAGTGGSVASANRDGTGGEVGEVTGAVRRRAVGAAVERVEGAVRATEDTDVLLSA